MLVLVDLKWPSARVAYGLSMSMDGTHAKLGALQALKPGCGTPCIRWIVAQYVVDGQAMADFFPKKSCM
ncbi:hypothetical protein DUNSADRAFT_9250 [Dunaliella salina]|uniref:Uncharacterized protein n=1 Tax=Dunaliella salina TaxID=3046 RepID=A0ABQ7GHU3_DUNSA|nr:hypothetical protein DUNSADRAFT_9250 [Dunaliella salina]|eukprot:KAF5834175.1 hypothetical protein DUNSADRAFT_9250 [Dunaliella salina]